MLLAWDKSAEAPRLVGAWALHVHDHGALWPSLLAAPPYNYAFLSNPVVEPEHADAVIAAFLDAIARDRSLPKVLRLKYLDGESDTYAALVRALAARGSHTVKLSTRARAFATKEAIQKKSGSTRKKLRQDWNRLSALGAVEVVNDRSCDGARDAFETFLAMEAASWKGERGTALLCHAKDAAFAHRLIANLAARECASRRAAAGRRAADRRAGAALLRQYRLHLEDRIRRAFRKVLAGCAAGGQGHRDAVPDAWHRGDRLLLTGRQFHGTDVVGPAHHGRPAHRCPSASFHRLHGGGDRRAQLRAAARPAQPDPRSRSAGAAEARQDTSGVVILSVAGPAAGARSRA